MLNQYACGVAVEAGVVGERADNVGGLIGKIARCPGAGNDDKRADIAKLASDTLVDQGLASRFASSPLGAGAEDDGLVGFVRASDVNLLDAWMLAKVGPFFGASIDQTQEASIDQRLKSLAQQGTKIGVYWIGFKQDNLIFDEEFVEDIHRPNAGDVAGAQYKRHFAAVLVVLVDESLGVRQLTDAHPRFHPDLCGEAHKKEAVVDALRKDA